MSGTGCRFWGRSGCGGWCCIGLRSTDWSFDIGSRRQVVDGCFQTLNAVYGVGYCSRNESAKIIVLSPTCMDEKGDSETQTSDNVHNSCPKAVDQSCPKVKELMMMLPVEFVKRRGRAWAIELSATLLILDVSAGTIGTMLVLNL